MSAPVNGVYTYTDETGATQTIDTNANSNPYDNTTSGLVATDVQAAIDEINAAAGTVALVDNGDGTYDFTDAGGNTTTITDTSISTMSAPVNGVYTYTDETGATQTIDTNANSNPYDNTTSGLVATDVQAAIDELNTGSTDDQNISGSGLAGTDLTIGIENGGNEIVDLSSLVETVVAGTGAITVTDDGNGNYTVNSTDPDEDLTNELTLIGAGAPAVTPSNSGVTYVDNVAGQLYVWDGAAWQQVGGSASPDLDPDPTNEHNTVFAVNGGNLEITDSGSTLSVPLSSLGTDDQNIESLGVDLGTNVLTVGIEDGTSQTVDLSHLDDSGTDDQIANEVNITDAGGNFTATEVEGALAELAAGSTDDQALSLAGNTLTLEDGGTVDLSGYVSTDDQIANEVNITDAGGNFTATEVEGALAELAAGSTDDQALSLAGNTLTLEDGGTVDLSGYVSTDDQIANEVNITDAGGNFTATEVEGALAELAAGSTDDQALSLAGNTLTLEDGGTVDLSGYVSTDDQIANEVNITDAGGNFTATEVEGALAELAAGSTDDQALSLAGNTLTLEDGGTVDLSGYVSTDDQIANEVNITDAGGNFTATEVEGALAELAAGSTDDQALSLAGNTLTLEDGGTVDLSGYVSTDDQALSLAGNTLTLEDGGTVDLSGYVSTDDQIANEVNITDAGGNFTATEVEGALAELAAGSTDDQALSLAGNTLTLEDGGTVDLSGYVSTDDQIANEVNITDAGGNFTATEVEGALAELALGSTDDQQLDDPNTAFNAGTNELTIALEDGGTATADLSALDNDDQDISTDGTAGNISIDDGSTIILNVDDADAVIGNEVVNGTDATLTRAGSGTNADPYTLDVAADGITNAEIADNAVNTENIVDGGVATADIAADAIDNSKLADDAVQLENIANGTAADQIIQWDGSDWTLVDLGSVTVTENDGVIGNEIVNGTDGTLVRSGAGTTVSPFTLDIAADGITNAEIADNAVQLENVADGTAVGQIMQWNGTDWVLVDGGGLSTDDQQLDDPNTAFNAGTNELTIALEDGGTATADLSALDNAGTDDQIANEVNITDAGGNFTATEVEGALAELAAGSTDDQALSLAGNTLTLEDGGTVDLSGYVSTDDQIANEVNITDAGGNFTATEVEGALAELAAGSTDDQQLDDPNTAFNAGTNELTIALEDGGTATADLSALDNAGTDDQIANEVNITDAGGNFTATEVEGALAELAAGSTDDQALSLAGNTLTLEDGGTVDLSGYVSTDDQALSLAGNTLTLEDGGTVDLSGYVSTDDQIANEVNITDAGGNFTATEVEGALAELAAGSTDDQALSLAGNTLTLEDGGTVDLSGYVSTDDQIANEVNITDAGGNFTATEVEGALAELAAGSTDDQALSLAGNTLTLEDGGTVDLSGYVSTDDQALSLAGNTLTLEDGGTVDLSGYVSTDDQIANEVNITDAGGNFTATEVEGALAELAAGSTDDQALSLAGNTLTLEDGGTVDLSGYVSTDDQIANEVNITDAGGNFTATEVEGALAELAAGSTDDQALSLAGNTLTLEDGGTVDLSGYVSTDDQALSLAGNTLTLEDGGTVDLSGYVSTDDQIANEVNITDAGGNFTATEVEGALAELAAGSTDDQALSLAGNTLTLEDGGTVDLSGYVSTDDQIANEVNITDAGGNFTATEVEGALAELAAGSTDDQALSLAGNTLTLEDGGTVDLSGYVSTDDQIANEVNITDAGGNFTATEVEGALAELAAGSTDDQALSLAGNTLTLEDGGTVDLSGYVSTDDQIANEVNITDAGGNFTATEVEGALAELAAGSTDDQALSLAGNTLTLEDGGTVDLSGYVSTDDQIANEVNITDAGGNFTATEVEGALAELAAGSTDDQALSLAGNTLTLEDGGTVDLSGYVSTDDQALSLAGNTLTLEDGGTVDLSGYVSTDDQIANEVNITDAGGNFTATEVEGALAELAGQTDDDVSVTNTIAGNRIATISEPGIVAVDINETVTSLTQNTTTGVISYTDEDGGAAETANVVGAEADNVISVGANGGAYLSMPTIYSTGKVNGNGTAAAIYGATVSRINEGDYQITFSTALSNANYIIQLATIDCNGDCPGNTSSNYDDPGITYYDQQTSGFKINIGDSDNGTTAKDDIDLEFMYTVIKLP